MGLKFQNREHSIDLLGELREKHISRFSLVASPHKGKNWLSHTERIPHRGSLTNYVDGKGGR